MRYTRDGIDYASNGYVEQYRDPNLLYKEYVGEELLNLSLSYTDMISNILFKL